MQENTMKICLLGGYGDVGLRLAGLLHQDTQLHIVLAGRNGQRAEAAARDIGPRCHGMALDVGAPDAAARLAEMALCINLTEATPPELAASLIAAGTHFIDSAATPAYVAGLGLAIAAVAAPRATAVLQTGLAPGLTNLLATQITRAHPETRSIDILIEMGMGTHHGVAATEWTLQALGQSYPMKWNGTWQEIRTGAIARKFDTDQGPVHAMGFAFVDQASIARDLDLAGARTFLAVDPGWMTRVLRGLTAAPLRGLMMRYSAPLTRIMQRGPTMGGTGTRLILEGRNDRGDVIATRGLTGGPQADMTAAVIAQAATALLRPTAPVKPGMQPLSAVLDPATITERPIGISGLSM